MVSISLYCTKPVNLLCIYCYREMFEKSGNLKLTKKLKSGNSEKLNNY